MLRWFFAPVIVTGMLAGATPARAQSAPRLPDTPRAGARLLDVPYVAQSAELCGGAALAMVLRYWGDPSAVAEDYAGLVDSDTGGIRTNHLVARTRASGWQAHPATEARLDAIRTHVDRGRPVIALIEERPDVFHYVVVVGLTGTDVVMHDPARSPFRTMATAEFERRWSVARRWMLIVTPGPEPTARTALAEAAIPPVCGGLVQDGIALASAGDWKAAESALVGATVRCPLAAAAWRELAGFRFAQREWEEAEVLAARAARLAPDDTYAWRLLGTTRFVRSDWTGALRAMNYVGEPLIDLVDVEGASRTPHPIVIRATGLTPRELLTPSSFGRARRRLADLPVAARARLSNRPAEGDAMTVEATIAERAAWPRTWTDWVATTGAAIADDELRVSLAGLAQSGEVWAGAWRWAPHRPRLAFELRSPAPWGLRGVAVIDAMWERQTYAPGGESRMRVERRRRAGLRLTDWASDSLRWEVGGALDRFDGDAYGATSAGIEVRSPDDRLAVTASAGAWLSPGAPTFAAASTTAEWRSTTSPDRPMLTATSGVSVASDHAPLAVWPGAGLGRAREALLRGHPLLDDGVVTGEAFGRRLAHATIEIAQPLWRHPLARIGIAGFVDGARAWQRMEPGASPLHVDVGIGARIRTPGQAGVFYLDAAWGRGLTLSAGIRVR
jgi:predicted double-glycine peptidase